jgi:thymidylate kinase
MIRGVVLEGCSAAGKTSVLKALKRRQAEVGPERSVIVLSEHYSQALQAVGSGHRYLSVTEHRSLLSERLNTLESLQSWAIRSGATSREAQGVFFLLERFHLNHRISYPDDSAWSAETESRLNALNAICFLLTLSPSLVRERVAARLARASGTSDASRLEAATQSFIEQQQEFLRVSAISSVRTVLLNTDDANWDRCAISISDTMR